MINNMRKTLEILTALNAFNKESLINSKSMSDVNKSITNCIETENKMQELLDDFKATDKTESDASSTFLTYIRMNSQDYESTVDRVSELLKEVSDNYKNNKQ